MKTSITIPDEKARQLSAISRSGTSRNQQVNDAIDFYLARNKAAIIKRTAGAWKKEDEPYQQAGARGDAAIQKLKDEWPE